MKKRFLTTFVITLCVLAGSQPVRAQSYRQQIHIPFDFTVNNGVLEAGDYTVDIVANHVLRIRDQAGKSVAAVLTIPTIRMQTPELSELVFTRYGSEYFLSKAFWAGSPAGEELTKSRSEILLASKHGPRTTMALVQK
jgi:hypothetical protein